MVLSNKRKKKTRNKDGYFIGFVEKCLKLTVRELLILLFPLDDLCPFQ